MLTRIALVLLVCVAVHAAPNKVCAPEKWTASLLGKVAEVEDGKAKILSTHAMVYVDYKMRMEAFEQMVMTDGKKVNITIISDAKTMKTYEIYPDYKKCTVRDLPEASADMLKRFCSGDANSTIIGSISIGGKPADVYRMPFHNGSQIMTIMSDSFEPVSAMIEQNYYGTPQMVAFQYGNITDDIKDMGVFKIPDYCTMNSTKEASMDRVCAPPAWESAGFGKLAQILNGKPAVYDSEMMISYDYDNKIEAVTSISETFHMKSILSYSKGTQYEIDMKTGMCTVRTIPTPGIIKMCSDSKQLEYLTFLSIDGMMADVYHMSVGNTTNATITVLRDSFQPVTTVQEMMYDYKGTPLPQMMAIQYGNFTTGIADRTVFDIPDSCKKASSVIG